MPTPVLHKLDTDLAQRSAATLLPGVGSLQELLRLLGLSPQATDQAVPALQVPVLRVQADGVLLHEGSRSNTLYVVRSGSFKCLRVQEDGYEQVLTFAQPGELLGWEALHAGVRQANVMAMEVSTVYALASGDLRTLQQRCPLIEDAVRQGLSRQLSRNAETAEMMVAVASEVRLARFILWLRIGISNADERPDDRAATYQGGISAAARSWQRCPFGPPRHSPRGSSGLDPRSRSQG